MENSIRIQEPIPDNIGQIALLVHKDWKSIYFGARPYLDAMMKMDSIHDNYFEDSAEMVVRYFLANATAWRGETARQVKAKLNRLLSQAKIADQSIS